MADVTLRIVPRRKHDVVAEPDLAADADDWQYEVTIPVEVSGLSETSRYALSRKASVPMACRVEFENSLTGTMIQPALSESFDWGPYVRLALHDDTADARQPEDEAVATLGIAEVAQRMEVLTSHIDMVLGSVERSRDRLRQTQAEIDDIKQELGVG